MFLGLLFLSALFLLVVVCFVCVGVFLVVFCLSCYVLGLLLFCSLCLLEWSRCCSCFVFFFGGGVFCLCMFLVSLCLFLSVPYENHCFHCNYSVLEFNVHLISVSHVSFWFLAFGCCFESQY